MATRSTRRAPASEAWSLVHELMGESRGHFLGVARRFDLSPPQLFALRALRADAPSPMGDLAELLHCDNSNITGIVDRLELRGLVERRPAAHDRRVKHLQITEEGVRIRDEIQAALDGGPNPFAVLAREDQVALRDLLRKALDAQ